MKCINQKCFELLIKYLVFAAARKAQELVWILLNLDECLVENHKERKVHKEKHLKNYLNSPS
jgi:hypothetical protein